MNTDGLADELGDVTSSTGHLSRGITIRFDPETLKELRRRARLKGIGPTTLVRIWVIERLQDEVHSAAPSPPRLDPVGGPFAPRSPWEGEGTVVGSGSEGEAVMGSRLADR